MKNRGNRILLLFLAIFAAAVLAAGCVKVDDDEKAEKREVTLTVKTPTLPMNCICNPNIGSSYDFLTYAADKFKKAYAGADVTINVDVFDYVNENEAIMGCYGTRNAADILYEGYFNMAAYVSGGHVVPLDDMITDKIRGDISDSTWSQSQKNGKTYMMPYLSMQNILIYNRQMFIDCGLEQFLTNEQEIQNWSMDEWNLILDTLAEKLPEGAYPMFMYANNNQGDTHIMSFLRAFGSPIFDDQGNFNFESEETIKALKWIQDGVARGWYAPHAENLEIMDNQQLFQSNKMTFYLFNNANFSLYDNLDENYGFVNFPGNIATSFITGFEVFDNGDDEKIKVAKDFIKFIYEDEELLSLSVGNIPESKAMAEKYADQIIMLSQFSENAVNVVDFMNSSPNWQGSDNSVRSVFYKHIKELLAGNVTPEECAAALNKDCNAAINVETKLHD